MINAIIEAISVSLNSVFGDDYEIHMEEIRQGLTEPCFFISCINPTNALFFCTRYFRSNQFCIQYFPKTEEKQRECNFVAEKMWMCLEYITIAGDEKPLRGTKMNAEVVDGILNFFVNYDYFIYCEPEKQISMDSLQSNTGVKEDE